MSLPRVGVLHAASSDLGRRQGAPWAHTTSESAWHRGNPVTSPSQTDPSPAAAPARPLNSVETEILNHRVLRHPHVIEFKEVFITSEFICIVMEYASGGNLFSYVQKAMRLKEPAARWFFQQLIIGLDYCHRRGVVNRDIKLVRPSTDCKRGGWSTRVVEAGCMPSPPHGRLPNKRSCWATHCARRLRRASMSVA